MKIKPLLFAILFFGISQYSTVLAQENIEIKFQESYDQCLREAKKKEKPVLLYFGANWCAPCLKQIDESNRNESLTQLLNSNFLTYRVDIDTEDGKLIAERFSVETFPAMVLTDKDANEIETFTGFYSARFLSKKINQLNARYRLF